jgi:hypothetical protein
VVVLNAKGRDQAVNSPSYRIAPGPESAVIRGGGDCQRLSARIENLEPGQFETEVSKRGMGARTLQNFAKVQVSHPQSFALHVMLQPPSMGVIDAAQIINPHRGIYDDQLAHLILNTIHP